MNPDRIAKVLNQLANGIDASANPNRRRVASDLRRILAFVDPAAITICLNCRDCKYASDNDILRLSKILQSQGLASSYSSRKINISCTTKEECEQAGETLRALLSGKSKDRRLGEFFTLLQDAYIE